MNAEIITTGTELLLGVISDTNSTYIARQFRDIGLDLYFITSAGDNQERVAQVIDTALDRSDVIITTGGLGPTVGDITREAVAQATNRRLVLDPDLLSYIKAFFAKRGYTMTANNERQAQIPEGAIPLENPVGTAPCFIVQDPRGIVISLPGVPSEMKYMMQNEVLPYLRKTLNLNQIIKTRTLKTAGIGESSLDFKIADLEESSNPTIGLAAHPGQVDVRITAKAANDAEANELLDATESQVRERIGEYIFGTDENTLESSIVSILKQRGLTIAVAEINTSGLIASQLNRIDPQGRVFRGGWVLPASHKQMAAQESIEQEAALLAEKICSALGADLGLVVINREPEQAHILALAGDQRRERSLRFRGYDSHAQRGLASYALDLVRRMCLERQE
ncbi:MAG: CinA family nicotinamide mononucleotide deamidase-related protein [Anaerolineae bacterium]|nr:CinA family nicotinamide mononucleotide deamidase-related protein [Anaerolineae bacterium]